MEGVRRLRDSDGFTLLELLMVAAIVAVLAGAALVGYRQSKIRAGEASTVSSLRSLNQAQFVYMQSCGKQRYAPNLVALGTPLPGEDHGLVSADLAVADPLIKSGYLIEMTGQPATEGDQTCTGAVPLDHYRITADPLSPGVTGRNFYGTNTDRVVYQDLRSFRDDMPEIGAPGHGEEIK